MLGTLGYGQQTALFEEDPGGQHDDDAQGGGQHDDDDDDDVQHDDDARSGQHDGDDQHCKYEYDSTVICLVSCSLGTNHLAFTRLCFLSAKKPSNECLGENFTYLSLNMEILIFVAAVICQTK